MDFITSNPGFQHISDEIFLNLDPSLILICQEVNQGWNQILNDSRFWLKMCVKKGLSKPNQMEWAQLIQATKDSYIDDEIKASLEDMSDHNHFDRSPIFEASICGYPEWIRILSPLVDNPNHPFNTSCFDGCFAAWTPIQLAALPHHTKHSCRKKIYPLSIEIHSHWLVGRSYIHSILINQKGKCMKNCKVKKSGTEIFQLPEIIKILAPLTQNPNAADPGGWTPINRAAKERNFEIIEVLAPLTENPNAADPEGWTPINRAAKDGNFKIIQLLAPLTNDPIAPDPEGWNPIHRAALYGNKEIIELLAPLSSNPNAPDPKGYTPIARAIFRREKEIIEILAPLSNDDPNAPDSKGWPPIARAAFTGDIETVAILAPLTNNPNAPNNFGMTPIQLAARNQYTGPEIIKILAPLVENPNAPDPDGMTPIHQAAKDGHLEIIKILAPFTKDPNSPNSEGKRPITYAEEKGNAEIVEFLNFIAMQGHLGAVSLKKIS